MLSAVAYCPDCCTGDGEVHTEQPDGCTDCCSPLCSVCSCFVVEDCVRIQAKLREILSAVVERRVQILASPFPGDIWQPPKRA
jgi:hypothetical protein